MNRNIVVSCHIFIPRNTHLHPCTINTSFVSKLNQNMIDRVIERDGEDAALMNDNHQSPDTQLHFNGVGGDMNGGRQPTIVGSHGQGDVPSNDAETDPIQTRRNTTTTC